MDLSKYEKIDGWQALERLKNEEKVVREEDGSIVTYELIAGLIFESESNEDEIDISPIVLNDLLGSYWYIKKPFDVRQAMRDKPNEWVGAYKKSTGEWLKVGFSTYHQSALVAPLKIKMPVSGHRANAATVYIIDNCIPIEDAPVSAVK